MDKPTGMRSREAVDYIQQRFGQKKVGHGGTLDPLATGLMVMMMGGATKINQFLLGGQKRYRATVRLGATTDTYDCEGEVLTTAEVPELTQEQLQDAFANYLGKIAQAPPAYAAIKVNGVPAYKMARRGETVELADREIEIHEIDIISFNGTDIEIDVRCSKGTYMRSLAHDIGQDLGCGGHLIQIRRLASYPFEVTSALTLQQMEEMEPEDIAGQVIGIGEALSHLPTVQAEGRLYNVLRDGRQIQGADLEPFLRLGFERNDMLLLRSNERVAVLQARTNSAGHAAHDFQNSPLKYMRVINL